MRWTSCPRVIKATRSRRFSRCWIRNKTTPSGTIISGVPFDLSKVLFIATANVLDSIPAPLRDRMEIIELTGYTEEEKLQIARRYLLKRQLQANGLSAEQVQISDEALRKRDRRLHTRGRCAQPGTPNRRSCCATPPSPSHPATGGRALPSIRARRGEASLGAARFREAMWLCAPVCRASRPDSRGRRPAAIFYS